MGKKFYLMGLHKYEWLPFESRRYEDLLVEFQKRNITIGSNVILGDRVKISPSVSIGNNVVLGDNVSVGYMAHIGKDAVLGDKVSINYKAYIGNGTTVGANNVVDDNVVIRDNMTIPAHFGVINGPFAIYPKGVEYCDIEEMHRRRNEAAQHRQRWEL